MPRSDQQIRQWKILKFLEANGRATLQRLASELDGACHERTLRRDLDALSLAGFPLYNEREDGKTYWTLDPNYRRFPIPLTATEIFALECGRELLRPIRNTFVAESLEQLYEKARSALSPKQRDYLTLIRHELTVGSGPHTDHGQHQGIVNTIREAIEHGRVVAMRYESSRPAGRRPRKANPYRLYYHSGNLYLIAYCHINRDVRIFAVDRIESVKLTERTFQWPLYFDLQEYFKGAFGVYRGKAEPVTFLFDKEAARWVKGRSWHASQKIRPLKGGRIRMDLEVAVTPELLQWVLGFGSQVQVERPAHLARAVQDAAWRLLGRYEKVGEKRAKTRSGRKKRVSRY